MGQIRGIKRIGPKPKFAPIRPRPDAGRPVAFFEDVHVKEGTTNDRLRPRRDSVGDQHVHHSDVAPGCAADTPKRVYRSWTDDEDLQIASMYRRGYTIRQIAEEIDRTWHSTNRRLIRLREQDSSIPYSQNKGRHRA